MNAHYGDARVLASEVGVKVTAYLAAALLLALASGPSASAQPAPQGVMMAMVKGSVGFVDAKGTALYTFDEDRAGRSACNGRCAVIWPPLKAAQNAHAMGPWAVITRADGTRQWAYMGKPVYTFARDKAAGDARGDNFGRNGRHVWHVLRPAP